MELPALDPTKYNNLKQFLDFWSRLYYYGEQQLYYDVTSKKKYSKDDLQDIYTWKNNMRLAGPKQISLDNKIKAKVRIINNLKKEKHVDLDKFENTFGNISFVWKIFLLHLIKPQVYPIYDQHIHRAYNYIHGFEFKHIRAQMPNRQKEDFYFNEYLPFIKKLKGIKIKRLDEGLFAFGQFINTGNNIALLG